MLGRDDWMKKRMIWVLSIICIAVGLLGCSSQKVECYSYDVKEVKSIEIETGAASIILLKHTGVNIEVSYTKKVAEIREGTMKINIPMPGGVIHLKKPSDLIVKVPEALYENIQIKSESGNISISGIEAKILNAETLYGNISIEPLSGEIETLAEVGDIKTELPISTQIEYLDPVGQKLNSRIGDSENKIKLYSETGTIELR